MENLYTEWKESWRDEYSRVVCGFANASGGVLEIGRDDKGRLVGLEKLHRKQYLGIGLRHVGHVGDFEGKLHILPPL